MQTRFIRPRELSSTKTRPGRWPVSTGTLWRWVAAGILPPPIKLGPQVVAWPVEVIEAYEAAQTAAVSSNTTLQKAVTASVAARQARRAAKEAT